MKDKIFLCLCKHGLRRAYQKQCRKKKEETKFTTRELTTITENVEANKGILQSKFTGNVTNKTKTETWKAITEKVKAIGVASRTIYEVQQKCICVQSMHPITPGKQFLAKKACLIIVFLSSSGQTMNIYIVRLWILVARMYHRLPLGNFQMRKNVRLQELEQVVKVRDYKRYFSLDHRTTNQQGNLWSLYQNGILT